MQQNVCERLLVLGFEEAGGDSIVGVLQGFEGIVRGSEDGEGTFRGKSCDQVRSSKGGDESIEGAIVGSGCGDVAFRGYSKVCRRSGGEGASKKGREELHCEQVWSKCHLIGK